MEFISEYLLSSRLIQEKLELRMLPPPIRRKSHIPSEYLKHLRSAKSFDMISDALFVVGMSLSFNVSFVAPSKHLLLLQTPPNLLTLRDI